MKKLAWLVPVVIVGYFLFKNVQKTIAHFSYSLLNIQYDKNESDALQTTVNILLRVTNPGTLSLPFDSYAGTLSFSATQVATFNYTDGGSIEPGNNDFIVPVSIDHLRLLSSLKTLLLQFISGNASLTVTINSLLTADGISIPLQQNIKLLK